MAPEGQLALNIPAFTVDQLMLEHSLPHLDLAKIDVEGVTPKLPRREKMMQDRGQPVSMPHPQPACSRLVCSSAIEMQQSFVNKKPEIPDTGFRFSADSIPLAPHPWPEVPRAISRFPRLAPPVGPHR